MDKVSLTIIAFILGAGGFGGYKFYKSMSESKNLVEFRSQADNFTEEVRAHLTQTAACTETLKNVKLGINASTNLIDIRNTDGSTKYVINAPYANNSFSISKMGFVYNPGDNTSSSNSGQGSLVFQLKANKSVMGNATLPPRVIGIRINKNQEGTLGSCVALSRMTDGIWQRSSSITDIYYSGGKVALNTLVPAADLHVNNPSGPSNLLISGNADDSKTWSALYLGDNQGSLIKNSWMLGHKKESGTPLEESFQIVRHYSDTTTPADDKTVAISITKEPHFHVGIGTTEPKARLEVSGEIRLAGAAVLPCSTVTEGAFRYNSTLKNMEFCDGTEWKSFSAGTTCPPGTRQTTPTSNGGWVCST
ncbi:MAG: hypothetical protein K2Q26_01745 [Bdellovibrionales bacterium]|nr:hypothetical protein [Bdellovibrionales bacterium]